MAKPPAAAKPRIRDEAPIARASFVASMLFLLLGVLWLVASGITPQTLQQAMPLVALGGFATLIFGTSRMLLAGVAGRAVAGPGWLGHLVLALAAVGALGAFAAPWLPPDLAQAAPGAWTLALLIHLGVVVGTARRPAVRPPVRGAGSEEATPIVTALQVGGLVYGLAAGVALPLAFSNQFPMAGAVHLTLAGFVTVTILAVAGHVLPIFTGRPFPRAALLVVAPTAMLGPAVVTAGVATYDFAVLLAGAALEATGLAVFSLAALGMLARSGRRRASFAGYAAACAAILAGVTLGTLFGLDPRNLVYVPAHGTLNMLGFVGLFVLSATTDLYAPALAAGRGPAVNHARAVVALAALGVLLAAVALLELDDALARAGLLLYAAAVALQLAGAASSMTRATGSLAVRAIPPGAPVRAPLR